MAPRTKWFTLFPWAGGVNNALDAGVIPHNQLTAADNAVFGTQGSRKIRDGINYNWDNRATGTAKIVGLFDFWYGSTSRTQRIVSVGDDKKVFQYNGGTATEVAFDASATAWSSAVTTAALDAMNNLLIVSVDGSANTPKKWAGAGTNLFDLGYYTATATATNGSSVLSGLSTLVGVNPGAVITGTGIPANTIVGYVASTTTVIMIDATTGALSLATSTSTGTYTFKNPCPNFQFAKEHLGRIWSNDKTNPDRLHYSQTGYPEIWLGNGDSGALDIGVGDGDPVGITAIFPSFHGALYVAKRTKLYKIQGYSPDTFTITLISDGIGCVGHNAVTAVDQDDIYFVSDRGVHNVSTTERMSDYEISYVSHDIQAGFNANWRKAQLPYIWAGYLSQLNSVAFAVQDGTSSGSYNNTIWLYNIPQKAWYAWRNVPCQSMTVGHDSDQWRFYLGGVTSRVGKSLVGTNYDTDTSGTNVAIVSTITTGLIFPENTPYKSYSFVRFVIFYRPTGTHTITVSMKIDNYAPQPIAFTQNQSPSTLGSSFVLGTSVLGYNYVMGPFAQTIEGHGHGFQVTFQQSSAIAQDEIQGFAIEYEDAGTPQENIVSG